MFRTTFFALACVVATTEGVQLNDRSMICNCGAPLKDKMDTDTNADTDDGETNKASSSTNSAAKSVPSAEPKKAATGNPGQKEANYQGIVINKTKLGAEAEDIEGAAAEDIEE